MDRNELYKAGIQLGLPVNSSMTKADFCSALSAYALSKVTDLRQLLSTSTSSSNRNKVQVGGYFDPVLNEQIDEDIQGGSDFADDLYDYDANMENDQDIEDDNGLDDDDEDETGYEYDQDGGHFDYSGSSNGSKNKNNKTIRQRLKTQKQRQIGGGNVETRVPIGLVHRAYIARLVNELPRIRSGAKARMVWNINEKASNKNFATGHVWIITQDPKILEDLREKTATFITELENENLRRNPTTASASSSGSYKKASSQISRREKEKEGGFEDIVKLLGPIHKRYIGQLIRTFPEAKRMLGFDTATLDYVETSEDSPDIGMGYVRVWSPNSKEEAVALGDIIEQNIQDVFKAADADNQKIREAKAAKSKRTRNFAAEMREDVAAPISAGAVSSSSFSTSSTRPRSPRNDSFVTSGPSWADVEDDDDIPTPSWKNTSD